jgi:replicative DNA helicase Mcm
MELLLEEDIVNTVVPGEQVRITGILKVKKKGKDFRFYVDVNDIEVLIKEYEDIDLSDEDIQMIKEMSNDPKIFDKLSNSIVPTIQGYKEVKDFLTLQLFEGTEKELPDGTRKRSAIHSLIVGDPGIGKSEMLKRMARNAPQGIYTSGKGSTAAGLTAAAVQDENGGWTLEGGALVLGDRGHVMIDEMDKMRSEDRSALHEAMEQQTISIAKAGITATLNTRASIVAAANPKFGKFDPYKPIVEQINLPATILSRFDVIFPIEDRPNQKEDSKKALSVIATHKDDKINYDIDSETFQKYVAYARQNIKPRINTKAGDLLHNFYVKIRNLSESLDDAPPITLRQLEAMIRFTEASAKAHLKPIADEEDAKRAINIMNDYLYRVGFDTETGKLDVNKLQGDRPKSWEDKVKKAIKVFDDLEDQFGTDVRSLSDYIVIEEIMVGVGVDEDDAEKLITEALSKRGR